MNKTYEHVGMEEYMITTYSRDEFCAATITAQTMALNRELRVVASMVVQGQWELEDNWRDLVNTTMPNRNCPDPSPPDHEAWQVHMLTSLYKVRFFLAAIVEGNRPVDAHHEA